MWSLLLFSGYRAITTVLLLVVVKTSQSLVNAIRSLVLPTYLAIVQYWYMWEHDYDKRDSS